jgi:hypothetical protein
MYEQQTFIDFYNTHFDQKSINRDVNEIELKTYIVANIRGLPKKTFAVIAKYDLHISEKGLNVILDQSARVKRQSKVNNYIKYVEYTGYLFTLGRLKLLWGLEGGIKYFTNEQEIQYLIDTVDEDTVGHRLILEVVG